MISNSTPAAHRTKSAGHGHGLRSSFTSTLRRKGSALVSLSVLLRKLRSNRRHPTNSHTLPTDPTEERPSVYHLEDASHSSEDWTDKRDHPSCGHRKRHFWTVSGTGSRARGRSTDIEYAYAPRLSRTRSLEDSLHDREAFLQEEVYTTPPIQKMPPSGCARDLRLRLHDPSEDPVDMTVSPLYLAYGYLCKDVQTWKNSNVATPQQLAAWDHKLEQLRALIDSLAEAIPPAQDSGLVENKASGSDQDGANQGSKQSFGIEKSDRSTSESTAIMDEVTPGPPPTPITSFGHPGETGDKCWWGIQLTQLLEDHMGRQDQQENPDGSDGGSIHTVDGSPRRSLQDELLQVGESFDGNGNVGAVPDGVC